MTHLTHSTKSVSRNEIERSWYLVDMKNKVLGRMIPRIATILQGKHKSQYVPYLDMGDNIVVVNAKYVRLTGKKEETKEYDAYSGYPGGLKKEPFAKLKEQHPEKIIRTAVSGMLPKNKLRDKRLARLHVFPDEKHSFGDKALKTE